MADPLDVKLILKASIIANPERSTVKQLFDEFRRNEGFEVPFRKFGFPSFYEYLLSLKDVCLVIGTGPQAEVRAIIDEKSAHVADMISKQRKPPKKAKRNLYGRTSYNNYTQQRPKARPIFNTYRKPNFPQHANIPSLMNINPNYFTPQRRYGEIPPRMINKSFNSNLASTSSQNGTKHIPNVRTEMREMCRDDDSDYSDEFDDCEEFIESNDLPCTSNKIDKSSSNMSNNLSTNSLPILSDKIGNDIANSINPSSYVTDETNPTENDNFDITNGLNATVNEASSSATNKMEEVFISDNEDELNVNYKVPFTIQQNLRILISEHKTGIWCRNMPGLYRTKFGTKLNYVEFGYKSLIQMCTELGYIFNHIQADKGDYKLYDKRLPLPKEAFEFLQGFKQIEERIMNLEPKSKLPAIPDDVVELLSNVSLQYPSQVLTICDNIPVQEVKLTGEPHQFIELKIAEVFDPSKFWFNLIEFDKQLNDLMDEMQVFYEKNWKQYLIPSHMLDVNLYCAINFMNEYHRALICNMLPKTPGKVKAFFIDYGTTAAVKTEGICYLHNCFKGLPAQGIRGRLARIHPPLKDNIWSRESATRFLDLIRQKSLVGEIDYVDEEANCFSLIITDTNGADDIFITDTLVYEGYALFEFQEQEIDLFMKSIPLVDYIYLFPTFDELEQTAVPSATEMITILQSGIPYHSIYPQYFKEYLKNEVTKPDNNEIVYADDENSSECSSSEVEDSNREIETAYEEIAPAYEEIAPASEEEVIEQANKDTRLIESLISPNGDISDLSQTSHLEPNYSNPKTNNIENVNVEKPQEALQTEIRPPILRPPPGFEHVRPNGNLNQQHYQNQMYQNPLWNYEVNRELLMRKLYFANQLNDPRCSNPYLQNMQGYNNQNFAQYYRQSLQQNYYQNAGQLYNPVNVRQQYNFVPPFTNYFGNQQMQAQFANRPSTIPLHSNQTNILLNQIQNNNNATSESTTFISPGNMQTHKETMIPKKELSVIQNIPRNNLQPCDKLVKPNEAAMLDKKTFIPLRNPKTELLKPDEVPVLQNNTFISMNHLQTCDDVVKPSTAPAEQKSKICIPKSNLQSRGEVVKPVEAPVIKHNIRPKLVVKTELFNKQFHVFLYKATPYVLVDEVQKQFFPTIKVPKLKKGMITCEIFLDQLVIKNNDVYEELKSMGAIDPSATIVDIFFLYDLEDLIRYFDNDKLPLEDVPKFINRFKKESSLWQ